MSSGRTIAFLLFGLVLSAKTNAQVISTIPTKRVQLVSAIPPIVVELPKSDSLRNTAFTYRDNRIPQPLFIADGKVITIKRLSRIDPQRIANIEVVKGEQAIAMFGSKGQNGVIVITMRKY